MHNKQPLILSKESKRLSGDRRQLSLHRDVVSEVVRNITQRRDKFRGLLKQIRTQKGIFVDIHLVRGVHVNYEPIAGFVRPTARQLQSILPALWF
ncbi:hypothetical protein BHE74_00001549 [Ensete ventricosum]|nr:hypothetical protein GW17_00018176 [Ensete ventricosum]RWW89505.1 hypothetical protein BHE74_00001549 [Ensete ventricosum]RZR92660.1 hypothetical protein BHM03_00021007 [Ensete ventricosum]